MAVLFSASFIPGALLLLKDGIDIVEEMESYAKIE
jgi:hypothetical protein